MNCAPPAISSRGMKIENRPTEAQTVQAAAQIQIWANAGLPKTGSHLGNGSITSRKWLFKKEILYIYNYIYNYCILDTLAAPNYKVVRNFSCSHFQLTHSSEVSWTLQSPTPPLHSACLEGCYRNPRSPCRHFFDPLEWFDKWYQQVQICWQYQKL